MASFLLCGVGFGLTAVLQHYSVSAGKVNASGQAAGDFYAGTAGRGGGVIFGAFLRGLLRRHPARLMFLLKI
ncbi:MAG: hypothetical protein IKO14_04960 [Oscillibacter sp.]|nr:hypothetical protein [Oscillibacter sp.]